MSAFEKIAIKTNYYFSGGLPTVKTSKQVETHDSKNGKSMLGEKHNNLFLTL